MRGGIVEQILMWSATDGEPHCRVMTTDQTCLLQLHSADDTEVI